MPAAVFHIFGRIVLTAGRLSTTASPKNATDVPLVHIAGSTPSPQLPTRRELAEIHADSALIGDGGMPSGSARRGGRGTLNSIKRSPDDI
jgi:hypothetical protein